MKLFLSSAVLLTIVSSVFGETCPEIVKGEKKFLVYNEKVNWFQALFNCSSQGMSLATIESQQEQQMIEAKLLAACPQDDCHGHWWVGGADLHKEGEFIWFSTNQDMEYQNFADGEPNNGPPKWIKEGEHCVELAEGWEYEWNDCVCDTLNHFVCEYFE